MIFFIIPFAATMYGNESHVFILRSTYTSISRQSVSLCCYMRIIIKPEINDKLVALNVNGRACIVCV